MSGAARGAGGGVCIAVGGTLLNLGGGAIIRGSLPGSGGCGATPRFGIGSATIGGITRVGFGAARAGFGTIDGPALPATAGAGCCDGDGCTWFGRRTMPSSATRRIGLMFLGGGATGCSSATAFDLTGNATFITGSRKRGPGTIVAPSWLR